MIWKYQPYHMHASAIAEHPNHPLGYWASDEPLGCFVSWDRQRRRWYLNIFQSPDMSEGDESSVVIAVGSDPEKLKAMADQLADTYDMEAEKKWKSEECRKCGTCCRDLGRHMEIGEKCSVSGIIWRKE